MLAASLADVPESRRTPYMICVYRNTMPDQFELYRAPLQEPLPNIPIPLRPGERDLVLELQPLIDECYRDGRYYRINYRAETKLYFNDSDLAWIASRLAEKS